MTSPRALLSMVLLLGLLAGQGGRGSMAFFTSTVVSDANAFSGGVVDIAGTLGATGSTASILTTNVFSWTASGASGTGNTSSTATCANILTGLDVRNQRMAPGNYCVAPIDVNNNNTNAVDAWMRIRAVRATPYLATGNAQVDAAAEALNDRLKLYMSEYAGGTADQNKAARDSDCITSSFKPQWALGGGPGTQFTEIFGSSSGRIPNGPVAGFPGVSRTALSTLEERGKNLGAHPGISALTVGASTHAYDAAQDTIVTDLRVARQGAGGTTGLDVDSTLNTAPASYNGLRLKAGTSAPGTGASGVAPAETNMVTTLDPAPAGPDSSGIATSPGARNAYNLAGTDDVTNPVQIDASTTDRQLNPIVLTSSSVTAVTGGAFGVSNSGLESSGTAPLNVTFVVPSTVNWTADGQVIVDFPSGYNVPSTLTVGSATGLSGGEALPTVTVNGNRVTLTRASGAGTLSNATVTIRLNGIVFPLLPIVNGQFSTTAADAYNKPTVGVFSPFPNVTGGTASATSLPGTIGTSTTRNGTSSRGTNREAEILKGERRFYCAAIFLPSDTDANFPVVYASTTGPGFAAGLNQNLPNPYSFATGQYDAGSANLGSGDAALTAANGRGDNAAAGGDVRYYLTVTAAQKAGRTVN